MVTVTHVQSDSEHEQVGGVVDALIDHDAVKVALRAGHALHGRRAPREGLRLSWWKILLLTLEKYRRL